MPKIIDNVSLKLTQEARRQVMELGYDAVTIRSVAKNCGIGVGTVYNYFPSKDALIAGFLIEDWMVGLHRIQQISAQAQNARPVLETVYRELQAFRAQYADLFRSAAATIPAPPRQYHIILREQISAALLPHCPDPFTADFIAESLLTWTVSGTPERQLIEILEKVL